MRGLNAVSTSNCGWRSLGSDRRGRFRWCAAVSRRAASARRISRNIWEHSGVLAYAALAAGSAELEGFSVRFLREHLVFPFRTNGELWLAVADPGDETGLQAARLTLGTTFRVAVASLDDLTTILSERLERAIDDAASGLQKTTDQEIGDLRDLASGAPVVNAVTDLFEQALEARATDIHIEPGRNSLAVRLRVDGLLRAIQPPRNVQPQAVTSRIKILAGLNITERRLPQDGSARLRIGRQEVDIRVATMPTQNGESVVIRLLPRDLSLLEFDRLGFEPAERATIEKALTLPHGLIIITGPTGSGKTTTLATMLSSLNETTRKILTIEDPIEYEIRGVNQTQVRADIGLTFAAALRSFLRQDPDVIMVGEIRDGETARIAVHASLTGHLVLTTLHTENAASAIPRLVDLGVDTFLLRSTLRLIIAQRLVRLLCQSCKSPYELTADEIEADPGLQQAGLSPGHVFFKPNGCERCAGSGYKGRIAISEVLAITPAVRARIRDDADAAEIFAAARADGLSSVFENGLVKAAAGLTSLSEVTRVATVE